MNSPDMEQTPDQRVTSRRALLSALIGAAVAAPLVASRASAEDGPTETTVAPPTQPVASDKPLLDALRAVELALTALYADATQIAGLTDDEKAIVELLHSHHQAYADSLSGLLGTASKSARDAVTYARYAAAMKVTSFAALAPTVVEMENGAAKRHTAALARIKGLDGANLVASIIAIEARHGAAVASITGQPLDAIINNTAAPIAARA